ncbi:glycosyl transferase [Caulobacter sp. Root487D2Y]|uniref:glycosyltransferase family 2 protein n=1 Tax=Caulobacter sp. Root487D2Y TaxID=1736547 RepID=UPI0006FADDD5|nr:glycosyltransferase [Caulobacter sp. Root487D2Y]KQY30840.1 glycosyl transferase [Caulobacter sp. Root487D2Y]
MPKLECALAESQIRPFAEQPALSIVIPTYERPAELQLTVQSIADQLKDGLEDKVELLISDNNSGPDTNGMIRALADRYPRLGYMVNARDEGGFFNLFAAPWRAQGRYTWAFGSDDVLLDGGVGSVVQILEREAPSFLTLNKRAANADLTQVLYTSLNNVPDKRFNSFIDLFCAFGINQLAFISAQIENTEAARKLDAEPYLRSDTRHPHVVAYLEKHAHAPAYYSAANHLVHRVENSQTIDYNAGNFFDYAGDLPRMLIEIAARVGAPADLFERTNGHRQVNSYDRPDVTLVDTVFENMLRALYSGYHLTLGHRRAFEATLAHCRPDRLAQLAELWTYNNTLQQMAKRESEAKQTLAQAREAALNASAMFMQSTAP